MRKNAEFKLLHSLDLKEKSKAVSKFTVKEQHNEKNNKRPSE